MLTDETEDLLWSLIRFEQIVQALSTDDRQLQSIKADALGDLLQIELDPRLLNARQIWFGPKKHDMRSLSRVVVRDSEFVS